MLTVSVGVGFFLVVSMLRILLGIDLKWLLIGFYIVVFALAAVSDPDFLSVAFDSGGVTTGPMTVPFIMALGVGVASIRSDRNAESDSFGLVGLCSIGPILAVLILGFVYESDTTVVGAQAVTSYANTVELGTSYLASIPHYMAEVADVYKRQARLRALTDRPFRCVICGDGELFDEAGAKIAELGLGERVLMAGYRTDGADILRASDIYVNSSSSEAMSFALLEAMNAALPLVVTDLPGNRELVLDDAFPCGLLAAYGDTEGYAQAVLRLMTDSCLLYTSMQRLGSVCARPSTSSM